MCTEAHAGCNGIIVQHAENTEVHAFGVVITGKTETVFRVEPAVVRHSARFGRMINGIVHDCSFFCGEVIESYDVKGLEFIDIISRELRAGCTSGNDGCAQNAVSDKGFSVHVVSRCLAISPEN